jgi:hypothetical protein
MLLGAYSSMFLRRILSADKASGIAATAAAVSEACRKRRRLGLS